MTVTRCFDSPRDYGLSCPSFHHVLSFTMTETTLAFIGGGNMTGSLVGGLIADGWKPAWIHVADPDPQQIERLARRFSIVTTADNRAAVKLADAVVWPSNRRSSGLSPRNWRRLSDNGIRWSSRLPPAYAKPHCATGWARTPR